MENAIVFNKLNLYSVKSFHNTIVISLSDIVIKNIMNITSLIFVFIIL